MLCNAFIFHQFPEDENIYRSRWQYFDFCFWKIHLKNFPKNFHYWSTVKNFQIVTNFHFNCFDQLAVISIDAYIFKLVFETQMVTTALLKTAETKTCNNLNVPNCTQSEILILHIRRVLYISPTKFSFYTRFELSSLVISILMYYYLSSQEDYK